MLSGYNFFRIHHSLNLHFTSNFDIIKYGNNNKSVSLDVYHKRRDKGRYDLYGNKFYSENDATDFCIANFIHNEEGWLYNDYKEADAIYTQWSAYFDAFKYKFKSEYFILTKIMNERKINFDTMLVRTTNGNNPPLMQLLIHGKLSPEFVITLNEQFKFINRWYDEIQNDPYLEREIFKLKKYAPLCNVITQKKRG
jgi:hypothetical protein